MAVQRRNSWSVRPEITWALRQKLTMPWLAALALCSMIGGCSYQSLGPIDEHYRAFSTHLPVKNKITVCSAYGCRTQTEFRFDGNDVAKLQAQMAASTGMDNPEGERARVATTLAWMEKRVGDVVGTSADRPGDDFQGNGDPTQMDCVDVATNLTSYLLVLEHNGVLKHHTVGTIFAKEDPRLGLDGWLHYTAVIIDNKSKRHYAVDGWKLSSGIAPEVVDVDKWYVTDILLTLGGSTRAKN